MCHVRCVTSDGVDGTHLWSLASKSGQLTTDTRLVVVYLEIKSGVNKLLSIYQELVPKEKKRRSFILSSKFSQKSKDKQQDERKDTAATSSTDAGAN